jgi:hypothetical protein
MRQPEPEVKVRGDELLVYWFHVPRPERNFVVGKLWFCLPAVSRSCKAEHGQER